MNYTTGNVPECLTSTVVRKAMRCIPKHGRSSNDKKGGNI